jgi:pimeloyl-ACP methyl ester carboxylesterase
MAMTYGGRQGVRTFPHVAAGLDGSQATPCEMGWFAVPENRHDPAARTIDLAFMRFKSTSPDPGPPLIVLEGGPGGPGIETFSALPDRYLCLREFGDVVVFDQRGVGYSRPTLRGPFRLELPLDRVITREEFVEEFLRKTGVTAAFWREQGVDLSGYTTEENADDVAALMEALGYSTFRTLGGSYGSHLSLAVIRRHAERIDRSFICMVEGTNDTYKLPSTIDRVLRRIAAMAATAPELEGRVPDLVGLMVGVFERLHKEPAEVDGVVFDDFDVMSVTANAIGVKAFLQKLPALYLAAKSGDFSWWASHVRELRTDPLPNLMSLVMDCASGVSAERLARIEVEAQTAILGDLINLPFPEVCPVIAGPDSGSAFREPVRSTVKALFASGDIDARTPPENALEVMKGFPGSQHILVENAAHRFVHDNPVVFGALSDFMQDRPVTVTSARLDFAFELPH